MIAAAELGGEDEAGPSRWDDALTAAQLFAIDPGGLGGITVVSGPGPVRDLWLDELRGGLAEGAPVSRLPAGIEDDRLLGGVDLVATLSLGRPVLQRGVLAEANGGVVLIPMAERLDAGIAARIAQVLDRRTLVIEREGLASQLPARIGVVAFDEGVSPDEQLPASLLDRLAFHIDLRGLSARGLATEAADASEMDGARARLDAVEAASDEIIEALVATASAFGIGSVVAPLLALRAARAAAALAGRTIIMTEDAVLAARLVLAPRARAKPAADDAELETQTKELPDDPIEPPAPPPCEAPQGDALNSPASQEPPDLEEIMLAAVQAALPDGLLDKMKAGAAPAGPVSRRQGTGAAQSAVRGRPVGVRMGSLRPGARLSLVDTLRAAAPWQPVRRAEALVQSEPARIAVRGQDFRIRKFVKRRESTIVFCVDASGSTAFQRLAEAKGAVELLLAEAYIARTHVALVVFRGSGADLVLPPTRSLSRAKALLAELPGGGGTPLAAGIDAALLAALGERARGRDPFVVLLTDGRANIGRDGTPARPRAMADAADAARQMAAQRIAAVFVDTSPRARGEAAELAAAMAARYVALPFVEAAAVRDVILAAVPATVPAATRGR